MQRIYVISTIFLILTLASIGTSRAGEVAGTLQFYGYATDGESGRYLYTETQKQVWSAGRWQGGRVEYFTPDGRRFGEKTLDFSQDPFIPVFRLRLFDAGYQYEEAVTNVAGDHVDMERITAGIRDTARVPRGPDQAAGPGFHSLILAHLDELGRGKVIPFKFSVAGKLDNYRFRVHRESETVENGRRRWRLVAEPDSLLRYVVKPLVFIYDPDSRRMLEYIGISDIFDPVTGRAYRVKISYDGTPPPGAPHDLPPLN